MRVIWATLAAWRRNGRAYIPRADQLDVPVLTLAGGREHLIPVDVVERTARRRARRSRAGRSRLPRGLRATLPVGKIYDARSVASACF